MTDQGLFDSLVDEISRERPGFEVRYKSESSLMKLLGFLMQPINPDFNEKFVTTWGNAVYFPSREHVETDPRWAFSILAHEYVHLWDSKKDGWKFQLTYALPQLAAIPLLVLFSILTPWPLLIVLGGYLLACLMPLMGLRIVALVVTVLGAVTAAALALGWWALLLLVALSPLAPWPSPGRTRIELRGYTMSVAVFYWLYNRPPLQENLEHYRGIFTGPAYYFMSWRPKYIEAELGKSISLAKTAFRLPDDMVVPLKAAEQREVYRRVYRLMKGSSHGA